MGQVVRELLLHKLNGCDDGGVMSKSAASRISRSPNWCRVAFLIGAECLSLTGCGNRRPLNPCSTAACVLLAFWCCSRTIGSEVALRDPVVTFADYMSLNASTSAASSHFPSTDFFHSLIQPSSPEEVKISPMSDQLTLQGVPS